MIITGSWDKTVRYWDTRQPKQAGSIVLSERVYTGSVSQTIAVIGCADRSVNIIDLRQPNTVAKVQLY